ncbi:MAG: CinA family nicotinamide mononucleotide deamidase-related protein [Bacteroidetes bacterium]|nr:CinA family nicotinamide mononucleotide deamidase-related protein [Bacteroidota bacterium]
MKTALLITIGDEILSGSTVDTNSNFIAQQLKNIGLKVKEIITISDEVATIESTFHSALQRADLVIATGGLGPTKDDKTKKALANVFQDHLVLDDATFLHLQQYLTQRKRLDLLELNHGQAEIPSKAQVFQNENGTAPALMMNDENATIICLPGVPYEVKPLIKNKIIPWLQAHWESHFIVSKIISVVGIAESLLSEKIENWELSLPTNMQLSYLPMANRIKLKLTASGPYEKEIQQALNQKVYELKPLVQEYILAWEGDAIEEILKEVLLEKNLSISVAESCTGGELSKLITSVSGSSAYFIGGIVAYDYHQKIKIVKVKPETIAAHTVVAKEVAQEMSKGCQHLFGTDVAIATTGVAGPNSDSFQNEIGLVYYSIRIKNVEKSFSLYLPHLERKDFMNFVAIKAIQDLVFMLKQIE